MQRSFIFFFLFLYAFCVDAQRGKHGDKVVSTSNSIVNEYTTLTTDVGAGAMSITVANSSLNSNARFTTNLLEGDLVMIIQMQGASMQGDWNGYGSPPRYDTAAPWGNITAYNNCGNYEYAMVEAIPNATTIDLHCGLQKNYTAAGKTQIIRVPRYNTLTINASAEITCPAWNGSTGGVVAVEVLDNTIVNGSINATGKGFRGGEADNLTAVYNKLLATLSPNDGGEKGESVKGYQADYDSNNGRYCKGAPANGGGGGNAHNAGGGGGANGGNPASWNGYGNPDLSNASWAQAWDLEIPGFSATTSSGGGKGGYTRSHADRNALTEPLNTSAWGGSHDGTNGWRNPNGGFGGRPLDYSTGKIFLGGAGGAGDADNDEPISGGNGGGLIYIVSYDTISGSGSILSNGDDGGSSDVLGNDGSGGGGAGGTIILNAMDMVSGISLFADGGAGGSQVWPGATLQAHGPGGGGGGGYVAVSNGAPVQQANGGVNGTTNANALTEFPANGATKGGDGTTGASITNYESVLLSNDTTVCTNEVVTLYVDTNGTYPPGMAINWYDAMTGGTLVGTGSSFTTPALAATITYYVGLCPGNYLEPLTITVTSSADASITSANTFCISDANLNLTAVDGGGAWTGPGITNGALGTFSPSTAGEGTHRIYYTIPGGSCGDVDSMDITVTPSADASITAAGPYCVGDDKDTLQAVDGGGTWSGTGISNPAIGEFDPAAAGAGTWNITYTIAGTCGDADNISITVSNTFDATIISSGPYCTGDAKDTLKAVDVGGTWGGTGISNATIGEFDPAAAGVGTHTITYTIAGSCGDADNAIITVTADLDPSITSSLTSYCLSDQQDTLEAMDGGGTWSGNGILNPSEGIFDPATAGVGVHKISYTISGPCGGSDTITINVNDKFDATINPVSIFCSSQSPVNLSAADPGGLWTGAGITDSGLGTFDPSVAGVGNHIISYTFSGSCGDQDQINIQVDSSANAKINTVNPFCVADDADTLSAFTSGGVWSGTGITDMNVGEFSPGIADTGLHKITYTISGTCGDADSIMVKVTAQLDATITSIGPICDQDSFTLSAVDAGGNWEGLGVQNATTGDFDPAEAGVGDHNITYTLSGACGDTDVVRITIYKSMDATITSDSIYCTSGPTVSLLAVDNGGIWSGAGILDSINGTFDPATAGVGTHVITYSISADCPDSGTVNIIVSDKFVAAIQAAGPFCASDSASNLIGTVPGGDWSGTGIDSSGLFNPLTAGAGTHTITYIIPGICGDTATTSIVVMPKPAINAGADVKIGTGQSTTLTASGGSSYTWSPATDLSCTTCENPDASPVRTTTYTLIGIDANACIAIDSVTVTIDDSCDGVFIPDAFSPNGDGSNDVFNAMSSCIDNYTLRVFDRWGEKVFETSDLTQSWDGTYKGKILMPAVFVYYFDGVLTNFEPLKVTGDVTLVR